MNLPNETCIIYNRMLEIVKYSASAVSTQVWAKYLETTPHGLNIMLDLGDRIERQLQPLPEMRERKRMLKKTIEYINDQART